MTGAGSWRRLSSLMSVMPSMTGIFRSVMTISTGCACKYCSASSPLRAEAQI